MSARLGFKVACVNWGTDAEVKAISYFLAEDGGAYMHRYHRTWAEALKAARKSATVYPEVARVSHLPTCEADPWDPPCEWGCNER